MTYEEKEHVINLQRQGLGSKAIAEETRININTIKTFLRRHPISQDEIYIAESHCKNCGKPITIIPGHRPRQFCSDNCRMSWWAVNRDKLNKKAWYDLVCNYCGKEFRSYGDAKQKYCCRKCYDDARKKPAE